MRRSTWALRGRLVWNYLCRRAELHVHGKHRREPESGFFSSPLPDYLLYHLRHFMLAPSTDWSHQWALAAPLMEYPVPLGVLWAPTSAHRDSLGVLSELPHTCPFSPGLGHKEVWRIPRQFPFRLLFKNTKFEGPAGDESTADQV